MKYSLRTLMMVALLAPPLLAGAYFAATDYRLRPLVIAMLLGGGYVLAAIACGGIFALASRLRKR